MQSRLQQGLRRTVEAVGAGDGYAGQQFRLQPVWLQGVELSQHRPQLLGLHRGHGVGKNRGVAVIRQPCDALRREVGVDDHHLTALQQLLAPRQHTGRQIPIDVHIRHRQLHIPLLVVDEKIGGGVTAGDHRGLGDIDAQLAAHRRQLLGVHIVAEGCQQPHIQPHQAHVVGDVPAYAAGAHPHPAGVGILCHQFLTGPAADVHVHTAHHRDVGAAGHDVALSGDAALFHQVGNMHRHAGPCDARPLRQLLLGDHGIRFDPVEYLPFPLGHAAPP